MRAMRTASILVLAGLAAAGCTGGGNGGAEMGGADPGDGPGNDLGGETGLEPVEHDFPAIEVQSGEEITSRCLSWTIHNEAPIFVQSVTLHAGPGWHHSNWFYVPEGTFDVVDGVWDCAQGEFDQVK